jgi:regulation of enolase protein 1 (concanavalin A-like superfamily)
MVHGQDPPTLHSSESEIAKVVAVDRQLQDRDLFLEQILERLIQSHVTMKQQQDKSWREVQFDVVQWVWLRLQQHIAVGVIAASPSQAGNKILWTIPGGSKNW